VGELRSIQGKGFDSPRIVIADQVTGEEEIPETVTAVVAPDVVDIVSHVAVRARNANVLFASCHDPELFQKLKSFGGRKVRLEINAAGDVIASETVSDMSSNATPKQRTQLRITPRTFTKYAIPLAEFDDKLVGSKSWHQKQLRGQLPDWVHQPGSAALPFGVFEKVLGLEQNREVAKQYGELVKQTAGGKTEPLSALRQTVLSLKAPEELKTALRNAVATAGLAWSNDWDTAWSRIKQVWASKWTERAFLSREHFGLPHDSLFMAVLIQQVVPADYAFVIHTVNPSNGNRDELFGEVVLGLGETLVGNYAGRALSFVSNKTTGQQTLLSFPGKSIGLYGEGLIFRSDSNGEDLAGYAGAGLYESVLLHPPRALELDYTHQPLVWDEPFRRNLLAQITRIGMEIEHACGSPQDIEGAVAGDDYYVVQTRPQVGLS
jgi:alpha-glucan,water dikinase